MWWIELIRFCSNLAQTFFGNFKARYFETFSGFAQKKIQFKREMGLTSFKNCIYMRIVNKLLGARGVVDAWPKSLSLLLRIVISGGWV